MKAIDRYTMRYVADHPDRRRRLSQLELFADTIREYKKLLRKKFKWKRDPRNTPRH